MVGLHLYKVDVVHGEVTAIKKPLQRLLKGFSERIRQRPTLPHSRPCSTIGAGELNFRVRNGNGWDLSAMVTEKTVIKFIKL